MAIVILSFILGRITKKPITLPDTRKLKVELYVNGIKDGFPFWKIINVDSQSTYDFKQLSNICLIFKGIEKD